MKKKNLRKTAKYQKFIFLSFLVVFCSKQNKKTAAKDPTHPKQLTSRLLATRDPASMKEMEVTVKAKKQGTNIYPELNFIKPKDSLWLEYKICSGQNNCSHSRTSKTRTLVYLKSLSKY